MKEEIKKLIDQRIGEARKKEISDKVIRILNVYGHKILRDSYIIEEYEEEEEFPLIVDGNINTVGLYYDFLGSGCNLQLYQNLETTELKITYKGYPVYQELNGEIKMYVPSHEWEEKIKSLFDVTKKRERKLNQAEKAKETKKQDRERSNIIDYLAKFWGFR